MKTTPAAKSAIAAIALVLPVLLWQVWAFFAPAVAPNFERGALRGVRRLHLLRRPSPRARLPHELRRRALRHPDPCELLLHLRRDDPARGRVSVPDADLRACTRKAAN